MIKILKLLDITLIIIPIIFCVLSVALIYSLVFTGDDKALAFHQGLFALIGFSIMIAAIFIDYRSYKSLWWIFYIIATILLVIVDMFGKVTGGAMRWINLGFFQLQPSEIAKVALIVSLASFFSTRVGNLKIKDFIWSAIIFVVPFALILKEPDLGTAMVVVFIYIVILFYSKLSKIQFVILILTMLLLSSIFILSVFNVKPFGFILKSYQRSRVEVFLNPNLDPYGQGYNVRQAQITLGSGGLLGRGLGQGSQSQLKFLPQPHTDFIFAGIAEAVGFIGSGLVIAIFALLVVRIITIGSTAKDHFGMLLSVGVASMFLFQATINIGMNLGLLPVTGIPLPFLSYGGTSLVISFLSLGILQSIHIRRKESSF